jgi:glycosyltransferase involved in cell wall biosynthesis
VKKPELSIVMITRDEAPRMEGFFKALQGLDLDHEVIVLDSDSRDATRAMAKARGARVYAVAWKGFAATKNAGFTKARAPWILSLDADENPDKEMLRSLSRIVRAPATQSKGGALAYTVNRLNYFLNRPVWRGGWHPDRQLRLFKRGAARFNDRLVHEGLETSPGVQVGQVKGLLHHHSYPDLSGYLSRMNRYTSLQAEELIKKKGAQPGLALARLIADPPYTFFKMYLLKLGVLEGRRGLALALLSASSTFWKYAKYWHRSWAARGGQAGEPWVAR